jgi:hypothetical protein
MPNIKPDSDLHNFEIEVDRPVFQAKNGQVCYAILDRRDSEKTQATLKLMSELAKEGNKAGVNKVGLHQKKSRHIWLYEWI